LFQLLGKIIALLFHCEARKMFYGGLLVQSLGWVGALAGFGLSAAGARTIASWLVDTREVGMPYAPPLRSKEA
jgi:hypothetical protein